MPDLRFVAAAILLCSWACAGGDGSEPSDGNGAQSLPQPEQPGATSSTTALLADDPDAKVLGGGANPSTEGSNTNWRPTEPWLDDARRPQARERPDPRKPAAGQQSKMDSAPEQEQPSTLPDQQDQQDQSSSSGSSSGSSSTPGLD